MDPNHITESLRVMMENPARHDFPALGWNGIITRPLSFAASQWCTHWVTYDHSPDATCDALRLSSGLTALWYQRLADDTLSQRTARGRIIVSGAWPHAVTPQYLGIQRSELIMVRPGATRAIFGLPASELACRRVTLDELLPGEGYRLEQRLLDEVSEAGRLSVMNEWIRLRTRQYARTVDLELVNGIRSWIGMNGTCRDISAMTGSSQRSLQRRFNDCVGLAPRDLNRLWQVGRAVREALTSKTLNWSALALRHGFYDQPHFIRSWSDVVGMSPTALMRRWNKGGRWTQGMILLPK